MKNDVKEEERSSKDEKYKNTTIMPVRMSNYPYFDWTASAWRGVKETFEVLLESQGLDELVNIRDEGTHGLKIDVR